MMELKDLIKTNFANSEKNYKKYIDILNIIKYRLIIEKNKKLTDRKLKFLINF